MMTLAAAIVDWAATPDLEEAAVADTMTVGTSVGAKGAAATPVAAADTVTMGTRSSAGVASRDGSQIAPHARRVLACATSGATIMSAWRMTTRRSLVARCLRSIR